MNYTKQLDLRRRFDEREKKKHQVRDNIGKWDGRSWFCGDYRCF